MPIVERSDARIYYEVGGEGTPVVFAHGAGGNRISWWQQAPHFEVRHRVVRIDHRGFGRSHCAPEHFHPRHFAADLLAVLDALAIDRAALVCQSMGGWTGVQTALHHPDRVRCLVLCGTPGGILSPKILAAAAALATRIDSDGVRGNAALAPDFPGREPALAFLYDQINALNEPLPGDALRRLFDESVRVGAEALADFRIPTLMVAGECDQLFPIDALREVAAMIPGASLSELPGCGHSTYFEEAATFNRLVSAFVGRH